MLSKAEKEIHCKVFLCQLYMLLSYHQGDIHSSTITKTISFLAVRNVRFTNCFYCFTKFWIYQHYNVM